jgi:prepilin-type N-terminal cleavage/methylation domain-containing protein
VIISSGLNEKGDLKKMIKKNEKGFTLVEALIVVVIIGVIAAVAIPKFLDARTSANTEVCRSNLATLNTLISEWETANSTDITEDGWDEIYSDEKFPDGLPTCPETGDEYALGDDGRAECPNGHTIVPAAEEEEGG